MNTTVKCDVKGCTYEFTGKNQAVCNRVLGLHRSKAHGIAGTSVNSKWRAKQKEEVLRNSAQGTPQVVEQQVPNFCPNCGCNLRVITAALNLRRKL